MLGASRSLCPAPIETLIARGNEAKRCHGRVLFNVGRRNVHLPLYVALRAGMVDPLLYSVKHQQCRKLRT